MAYQTPTYDYGRRTSDLTTQKGLQDIQQNYGRFLSQERFRRGTQDASRMFKEQFPRIGQNYNRRNMYHSGMRQRAQRQEAQNYQRQSDRFAYDHAAEQQYMTQQQAMRDAGYQQAMLALYEDMQRQRAAGYDPYGAIRGTLS